MGYGKLSILKITNLTKSYKSQRETNTILSGLNLEIEKGEFVCILGPSGCGKSTLIRCIAGFEDFDGTISSNGKVVTKPDTDRVMVFQDFNQLYPWKTVEKNIMYPLKLKGIKDKKVLDEVVKEALRKVDLDGKQKFYPHELSGGMKQRVAIAKTLAMKPDIILMDEPFAALDAMTRNNLQKELLKLYNDENITIIFITHNIQEAIVLGTRVMLMSRSGEFVIDKKNPLKKPCSPSSEGYGEMWSLFSEALNAENIRKKTTK